MQITPMGPRVLLRPQEEAEKTESGIYIPEEAREKRKQGVVAAVGTTEEGKALPLKEGDTVIYGGYSDETVDIDGEEYIIVEFKDVIAKLG